MVVPAYYFVKNKQLVRFLLVVVLAFFFHRSAFCLLGLYPVYHMRLSKKMLIWILPVIAVIYLYSRPILTMLIRLMGSFYQERYSDLESTGAYSMLLLFVMLLLFSYIFTFEENADADLIGMRNILVLSVVLQCFTTSSTIVMRMNYYYLMFLPLLIPKVISQATYKNAFICKIANIVLCTYFLYYFLDKAYSTQTIFQIYPYVPFWAVA